MMGLLNSVKRRMSSREHPGAGNGSSDVAVHSECAHTAPSEHKASEGRDESVRRGGSPDEEPHGASINATSRRGKRAGNSSSSSLPQEGHSSPSPSSTIRGKGSRKAVSPLDAVEPSDTTEVFKAGGDGMSAHSSASRAKSHAWKPNNQTLWAASSAPGPRRARSSLPTDGALVDSTEIVKSSLSGAENQVSKATDGSCEVSIQKHEPASDQPPPPPPTPSARKDKVVCNASEHSSYFEETGTAAVASAEPHSMPGATECAPGESGVVVVAGLIYPARDPYVFGKIPPLKNLSGSEFVESFHLKIAACTDVIFDFRGIAADYLRAEKEEKKVALNEILDCINESRDVQLSQALEVLIRMVARNIFRPLPPVAFSSIMLTDPEEAEPHLDNSWPHLQLVYEILLRVIMSNEINPKSAKKVIDFTFVMKLLNLFASEDPRERDYLKTIMHRVYGKIMALRAFIRNAIQHVFYRYIHEEDGQPGVSELLEILGSIINGFAHPLKPEHKQFLKKCMIPLHKSRQLITFHQQLTYCMTQYIEKDEKLVEPILLGILRYWPVTSTPKEVLFINEIEEILELTPAAEFQAIMNPLFRRMALCIQSPHFQVAERVLFLWNNTRIVKLINQNKAQLFPLIIGALYRNTKDHWNATVHGLTFNVSKILAEADPNLFDRCILENTKREERRDVQKADKQMKWLALRQRQETGGCGPPVHHFAL